MPRPGVGNALREQRGGLGPRAAKIAAAFDDPEATAGSIEADCRCAREALGDPPTLDDVRQLLPLLPLVRRRFDPRVEPVFRLLDALAGGASDPWPVLTELLAVQSPALGLAALERLERRIEDGAIVVDAQVIDRLGALADGQDAALGRPEALERIERILVRRAAAGPGGGFDAARALYLAPGEESTRRLAARLLDRPGRPVRRAVARRMLGASAYRVLAGYLDYTRATHLDLLQLAGRPGQPPPIVEPLRRAERVCGPEVLREIVAELGWSRLGLGLEVRSVVGLRLDGSMPLAVDEGEAALLEAAGGVERAFQVYLALAHGGTIGRPGAGAPGADRIARFRACNQLHAELLDLILQMAPLTRDRVEHILEKLDRVVADFVALFAAHSEECSILPALYAELRGGVLEGLAGRGADDVLGPEMTRRVLAFEDPQSLGAVATLHGLKRYLHQRGLHLGGHLTERGASADRSVSLVLASSQRVLRSVKRIRYADFDPDPDEAGAPAIPFAVALAAEAFALQLLHGQEKFPHLDVLCYGSEVHYYLTFWNHPAFLRIAYSPPLRGGMIDLRYYGVSNYELSTHPDQSLTAIRTMFARLGFDVQIDGTLIRARLDKERVVDLARVIDRAAMVLGLAPHFMDLDWTIGSLDLAQESRVAVAEAWASRFALWGALPVAQVLTADRRGILVAIERGATAEREVRWSGSGDYRDRLGQEPPVARLAPLLDTLREAGVDTGSTPGDEGTERVGQVYLERRVLRPLREALAAGAVTLTPDGLHPAGAERFRREHEAQVFAELLAGDPASIRRALEVARLIDSIERVLQFRTTGSLNGYPVERAGLRLRDAWLSLFVLRGPRGVARLALFCRGTMLFRRRDPADGSWVRNARTDAGELARLLRRSDYLAPAEAAPAQVSEAEVAAVRERFASRSPRGDGSATGARSIPGLRAAPGRAVGRAALGTRGRTGPALRGRVLFAAALGPEDNALLYHALGLVSTGGGVLSHAGLLATQFGRPALVVPGRWEADGGGSAVLVLSAPDFREVERMVRGFLVRAREDLREREVRLREGDLVVLDADAGCLDVLGQRPEALALHEELGRLDESARRMGQTLSDRELLGQRGQQLRALHQLHKLLRQVQDPDLARHAVHELLLGVELPAGPGGAIERARLLTALLGNPQVGAAASERFAGLVEDLGRRFLSTRHELEQCLAGSTVPFELLWLRLAALELKRALEGARAAARACGLAPGPATPPEEDDLDARVRRRLGHLREAFVESLAASAPPAPDSVVRHRLRRIDELDLVLGEDTSRRPIVSELRRALRERDARSLRRVAGSRVLTMHDAAYEHHAAIGWKAANLAEVRRLAGEDLVPPWFVVTDHAFREMLEVRCEGEGGAGGGTLGQAVEATLAERELDDARKSARIRAVWDRASVPESLAAEVLAAYHDLAGSPIENGATPACDEPFVAVRSSTREEDAEAAARAGEFDTFLFVRGGDAVLEHLKRAWAGLWTERAIHNRRALGGPELPPGGGILIQRMIASRASGVLHTVNVARRDAREIVIDAGLGLGEGVVGGVVDVDHFAVAKPDASGEEPLRFHCAIAEKREKVVFNRRAGGGTIRVATLYHEGLRPALEYVELAELVRIAVRLEAAYGFPLDIEFALEGHRLWVLQARPVPSHLTTLRTTLSSFPLGGQAVPVTSEEVPRT